MKKIFLFSTILTTSICAHAEIRINGFANMIGGLTSNEDVLFDYDDDLSFDQDSLFAVQVSGDVNDSYTATAQIVARGENSYEAEFEWAYITHEFNDSTSVSLGRIRVPLFKYSSTLEVGYSYHWIRPPEPVYDVSFNTIEGIRVDHNGYSGDWEYNLQLFTGSFKGNVVLGGLDSPQDIRNIIGGSAVLQRDWFSARIALSRATLSIDAPVFDPLFTGLTQAGFGDFTETLRLRDDSGQFAEVSIEVDKNSWFVSGEFTRRGVDDSFLPEQDSYYITGGLRIGSFTPHLTYIKHDGDPKFITEASTLPEPLRTITIGALTGRGIDTTTITAGLRYDVDTSVALKIDLTQQDNDFNRADTSSTLLRFGINYIF
ncbi:porin [Agarilytica rhodophyticola]|uniref:porin n=1 Tax=Agarilytica rhodophyticola TaxID=1737490 RepID=UPI000B3498EB|nr:porin [Agarilytica rhodophyticola]